MALEKLIATIGNATYAFRGTAGLYSGAVSAACGIAKATEAQQDIPEFPVKSLIQKGILRRVSGKTSYGGGKVGRLRLLVAKDKLGTALDELNNKPYTITGGNSGTIKSVGFALRVVSRG